MEGPLPSGHQAGGGGGPVQVFRAFLDDSGAPVSRLPFTRSARAALACHSRNLSRRGRARVPLFRRFCRLPFVPQQKREGHPAESCFFPALAPHPVHRFSRLLDPSALRLPARDPFPDARGRGARAHPGQYPAVHRHRAAALFHPGSAVEKRKIHHPRIPAADPGLLFAPRTGQTDPSAPPD